MAFPRRLSGACAFNRKRRRQLPFRLMTDADGFSREWARSLPTRRSGGQATKLHSVCRSLRLSASEKGAFSLPMLMLSAPTRLFAHGDDSTLVRSISEGPKMAVAPLLFGVADKS